MNQGWTYTVKGGGGYCSLDDCIDMCFDHSDLARTCSRRQVKEFCLTFGFFAFSQGVIFPLFEEGFTSIDFLEAEE